MKHARSFLSRVRSAIPDVSPPINRRSLRAKFYYTLRIHLHKRRRLLRFVQIFRGYILLGPLRNVMIRYYQKFSRHEPLRIDTHPIFPDVNAEQLIKSLNDLGYAHVGKLPEDYVTQILDYCAIHRQTRYWNPHKNCEAVDRICRNRTVVDIARKYLRAEPILWLTQLKWSFPVDDDHLDLHPSIHREPVQYDAHAFHYDIIDFKSLTLFVYLTDIDSDASAHVIIEGTHEYKTWENLTHMILDDDVAQKKFGQRIKVISGKKGTAFFEETSSYHKVAVCQHRRLILSINYVLQRRVPPERPPLGDYQAM